MDIIIKEMVTDDRPLIVKLLRVVSGGGIGLKSAMELALKLANGESIHLENIIPLNRFATLHSPTGKYCFDDCFVYDVVEETVTDADKFYQQKVKELFNTMDEILKYTKPQHDIPFELIAAIAKIREGYA